MLQEARVPAQALNAAVPGTVKQRGVEVTPASEVSHHGGEGKLGQKVAALLVTNVSAGLQFC